MDRSSTRSDNLPGLLTRTATPLGHSVEQGNTCSSEHTRKETTSMTMRAPCHPRWQETRPDLHGRATARADGSGDDHRRQRGHVLDMFLRSPSQFHDHTSDASGAVTPQAGSPC